MKPRLSPKSELENAQRDLHFAEQICPHWDYESDGLTHNPCCDDIVDARERVYQARQRVKRGLKQ